jgi:hypothetical protein
VRKKVLKILAKRIYDSVFHVMPGDSIELRYYPPNWPQEPSKVLRTNIDKYMDIDTMIVFELENELGLEVGIGGAFGKEKK